MISYLIHSEIDKARWDKTIENSVNGITYAYSWYLDIVSPGWEALVLNDYEAVMPLTCKKKYGVHYLFQPFFTQQLGVFSSSGIPPELVDRFLNAIPEKYRFIEIQLNQFSKPVNDDFTVTNRITHHLGLNRKYEEIYRDYSENLKRNLKKVNQKHLKISENLEPEILIVLFKKNQGIGIKSLQPGHYHQILDIMRTAIQNGSGSITGVYDQDGSLNAGAFFVHSHQTFIYLFPSTNAIGRETGAMPFLIDHFIQQKANRDEKLDFEGSMIPSIARFYKGFGAKESTYYAIKRNRLPRWVKWIKK